MRNIIFPLQCQRNECVLLAFAFITRFLLSVVCFQYCKYLHENLALLRPVDQTLKAFSEQLKDDSLTVLVSFSCVFEKQKSGDLYSAYPAHSGSSRH
jgi:hypothetical protein